jgi:hypothetical protein
MNCLVSSIYAFFPLLALAEQAPVISSRYGFEINVTSSRYGFEIKGPVNCSSLSPIENSGYWQAMESCYACAIEESCGYCHSTMRCEEGNSFGPLSRDSSCPHWIFKAETCPINPECHQLTDCGICAAATQCVWCGSDARCMSVEESIGSSCRAIIAEEPCPAVIVPGK